MGLGWQNTVSHSTKHRLLQYKLCVCVCACVCVLTVTSSLTDSSISLFIFCASSINCVRIKDYIIITSPVQLHPGKHLGRWYKQEASVVSLSRIWQCKHTHTEAAKVLYYTHATPHSNT